MKPQLNDKRKRQIRVWLGKSKWEKRNSCPFVYINKGGYTRTACKVCDRLFPEVHLHMEKSVGGFIAESCPCVVLGGARAVAKRAKEWVK